MLNKISDKLQRAREYEKENGFKGDLVRQNFHVSGTIGWINDPNGFSVYNGEYHLFYQYHPYDTFWGPMHWGHLKTSDFIRWDRLPVALAPDTQYDKDGCFSGNAIELPDHRHLLMYTGVMKKQHEDGRIEEFQQQCIAIGDGTDYEKVDTNPVITYKDVPEGASTCDFRDPKIYKDGEDYYALVANRAADGAGSILMFTSKDGVNWSFVKVFASCNYRYGTMWECPDFFALDGKHMFVVSPMEMETDGLEFHAGHGVVAMCGNYDKESHDFISEWVQAVDYGTDFYAPQTLVALDGRRIMIGWMRNWATTNLRKDDSPIFGAMTLPRELSLKDGRLMINPVREIENYWANSTYYEQVRVKEPTSLDGIKGRCFDMTVTVNAKSNVYSYFKISLGKGDRHSGYIIYRPKENTITIDRTHASKPVDTVNSRCFAVRECAGQIKLRIIMDNDSVELFVNDGDSVATFLLYNDISEDGIEFESDEEICITVAKHDIRVEGKE